MNTDPAIPAKPVSTDCGCAAGRSAGTTRREWHSVHLAVLTGPIRLAQLAFEDFSGRIAGQRVDEIDRAGHLETAHAGSRALDQLLHRDFYARLPHHHRPHP